MAGRRLFCKEIDDGTWIVSLMHYDPGYIDLEQKTLHPSTTRSARGCSLRTRYGPLPQDPEVLRKAEGGQNDSTACLTQTQAQVTNKT